MQTPKLPKKNGAKTAEEIFRKTRKKSPSDQLVEITSKVPERSSIPIPEKKDRAAKDIGI